MDGSGIAIACASEDSCPAAPTEHADRGQSYDQKGISRKARESYYKRMRAVVQRYQFPLVEFEDHDDDAAFLDSQEDHLTGKGWMFYDRVLDDFFHGRMPPI
jgi:poly-D-alanine transfer protein DltD